MLSITFYSKTIQYMGSIDYTLDFAEWLLEKGLYRIEGVRSCETIVLRECDEEGEEYEECDEYEIEVVLLTSATRKKLLKFLRGAITTESLKPSWKIDLLQTLTDFVENEKCLYMDYLNG